MAKKAQAKGLRVWIGGQGDGTWSIWLKQPTDYRDNGLWYGPASAEPWLDSETGDGPEIMRKLAKASGIALPAPGKLLEAMLLLVEKGA